MKTLPTVVPRLAAALMALAALPVAAVAADDGAVSLEAGDDKVTVRIGGEVFTEYHFGAERAKPILFPVIGPGGVRMTRDFPIVKGTEGEAADHPHHESLWFTHGDVNGIDFWSMAEDAGTIRHRELVKAEGNQIVATHDWVGPEGKVILTDTTTLTFHQLDGDDGARAIDFRIALHAGDTRVVFGDTKEGTMGIRSHPNLRLSNDPDRGVTTASGKALNSAGTTGKEVWGEHAKWVTYWGEIDGNPVGFAIFDHPSNPRFPTTWHARDYGLVAANPFGLHDFGEGDEGAGDFPIEAGDTAMFQYRFVFYPGTPESAGVADLFADWSK